MKVSKRVLTKALFVAFGLWLVAVVITARPGNPALYPAAQGEVTVYIVSNGFHTDLALPAAAINARGGLLAKAGEAAGGQPWQVFGWGDAGFYTAKGVSAARAVDGMRALFKPGNPSVIRVFGVSRRPDQAFEAEVIPVALSRAGFEAMARRMEASFLHKDGQPVRAVLPNPDAFFKSPEHFSILRMCNHWTGDQLNAAGVPTTPLIDGLAPAFALDLRLRAGLEATKPEVSKVEVTEKIPHKAG